MKTTAELVDDALVGVKDYLATTEPIVPEEWEDSPKSRYVGGDQPIDHGKVARLRLDWELLGETNIPYTDTDHVARLITTALKWDLVDIIENGDIYSNDVMLKSMDGANKLGRTPMRVIIEELTFYREDKPKKKSHEYTLFLLLRVDWQ